MTIGEALEEIVITMQADNFWADLSKPVVLARDSLAKETDEARQVAVDLLAGTCRQIDEIKHYFKLERGILQAVADRAAADRVTPETTLPGIRTTRSPETEDALAKASIDEPPRREQKAKLAANPDPFEFGETLNCEHVTVTIKVPPATKGADVKVSFKPTKLDVAVRGHALQPSVISGELAGPVDTDCCSWTLEGAGEGRRLVLDLEKKMGGIMWTRLLKA